MSPMSFGSANTGLQLGNNHGTIGTINISSDRPENPVEKTDNDAELLRSLAFPQMLDRRDNIEPCHTNTCQWILELDEYQSWRNQSCGLLWVKGKPGAGKSTLMAFLHDKLKESQDGIHGIIRLDFFFTARGTEMQRTPLGMLRSLLNQIFVRDATIRPQVREIYEQRCRQFGYGERKWEWPQMILEELLATAILASANEQPAIIFVDALDEAGAESAQKLAAYFHRLVDRADKKKLTLQVCISCRHYPILESAQARAIYVEHHNQDDIATYIKDTLLETELEDVPNQEIREVLVEELSQHAKGVFQWANLIMPLVKQQLIEGESISDIRDWLGDVPADLENVYVYILSNVITARNRDQSFLFFQWVCLAERPLTIVEIRYALAAQNAQITSSRIEWEKLYGFIESNERMKKRVKVLSGGLAEVVSSGKDEETVQVVHQSVNDFFRAKGLAFLYHGFSASMGSVDMDNIHSQSQATLYRSCLVYLAAICSNKQMSNFRGSKEKLVGDHPFLNYTTINLFVHAEKAAVSRGAFLQNEKDILRRMISYWVEFYQRLDFFNTACPPTGTTILHMAASANLVDVTISVLSDNEDIERKNEVGNTALHFAARAGHTTAGKILQERGANREAKNNDGATPLTEAARCGHLGFVGWLLDEGVEIETGGGGALQKASLEGHSAIVVILLGAGANVNAQGGEYGNALQAAAYNGSAETVKILLDAQADVNTQGGQYGNALQAAAAAFSGSAETVKILLDAQADVNAQGGEYGNALQAAAWSGSAETVKILLDAQADVNTQGGNFGNALQAAALSGSAETVKILLDAGADVNAQGGQYGNALQAAAWRGSAETVKMLLDAQADVNAQGGRYGNALHAAAAAYNGSAEKVKILLEAQADVNAQGGFYGNALQAAAWRGCAETVKMLLDAGADVNAQGGFYGNALQAAAWRGCAETVKILLDAQADVNAHGGRYGNALQAAAYNGNDETVKILLEAQADVNAQGGRYGNALQAAAYNGNDETVKMLLDAQADVNTQGGRYGNALQAAAWRGCAETVKMLLDAQADVNAQGGQHRSPLLAAIYSGHADVIEILIHAGADIGLVDALDQTPLHIAASKDMAHLLFRFPQLALAINKRNKLLQTPLHLAIYFGHIHFAIKLLHLGADPSLPDGYGRHAMDWAIGQGTLMREIRERCPRLLLTPHEIQESTVQQSLLRLSGYLPELSPSNAWLTLQQLARYFLFLDDTNNARHLFQVRLSYYSFLVTHMCKAICNFCNMSITGPRFVCRICANVDICSSCVLKHPFHYRLNPDLKHEVIEMPGLPDDQSQLTEPLPQQLIYFLNQRSYKPLGKNNNQSEMKLSKDSSCMLSREKNALVPNTSLKLVVLLSAILFGLLATFLGSWYF